MLISQILLPLRFLKITTMVSPTSDQIISLSTSIGFDYNGTELFNNGASGVDEYLVFSQPRFK